MDYESLLRALAWLDRVSIKALTDAQITKLMDTLSVLYTLLRNERERRELKRD